jgi:site-specific DNA-methyltransferase (adenine-specific)
MNGDLTRTAFEICRDRQQVRSDAGPQAPTALPVDAVLLGDCVSVMATMPGASVDFVLTDPPYLVHYRELRDGRQVTNDDNARWVRPAFAQIHRVMKPGAFCVSFYAWNRVETFTAAWRAAGFRIAGHFVFRKQYASSSRYVQHRHECAYLLVKGGAALPAKPIPDVLDWSYTGNRLHPTQKPVSALKPIVAAFSAAGGVVLDPFCGSGSTLVAAKELDRSYVGIELDAGHHRTATERMRQIPSPR